MDRDLFLKRLICKSTEKSLKVANLKNPNKFL